MRFDVNQGLTVVIAAGYGYALREGYAYCGRVDADGQHPAEELARLLERVRSGSCDVAVGSRFVSGEGYEPYRYRPSAARAFGTSLLRRAMAVRLGRDFGDATSGTVRREPKGLAAPRRAVHERRARGRVADPAERRGARRRGGARAHAGACERRVELRGKRAVKLVVTVIGTLAAAEGLRRVARRRAGRRR